MRITVYGLGGPRCTVEAASDWTIQQVQEAIFRAIDVPVGRQILAKGKETLEPEVLVSSVTAEAVEVDLTLVVDQEDAVTEDELWEAFEASKLTNMRVREEDAHHLLSLLRRRRVKGLNRHIPEGFFQGFTYLQAVAFKDQDFQALGCAILERPDFTLVNAIALPGTQRSWHGHDGFPGRADGTALHFAAAHGFARLCRAIVEREDFVEFDVRWSGCRHAHANDWARASLPPGETAAEVALRCGYHEIHEMLVAAREARAARGRAD